MFLYFYKFLFECLFNFFLWINVHIFRIFYLINRKKYYKSNGQDSVSSDVSIDKLSAVSSEVSVYVYV